MVPALRAVRLIHSNLLIAPEDTVLSLTPRPTAQAWAGEALTLRFSSAMPLRLPWAVPTVTECHRHPRYGMDPGGLRVTVQSYPWEICYKLRTRRGPQRRQHLAWVSRVKWWPSVATFTPRIVQRLPLGCPEFYSRDQSAE